MAKINGKSKLKKRVKGDLAFINGKAKHDSEVLELRKNKSIKESSFAFEDEADDLFRVSDGEGTDAGEDQRSPDPIDGPLEDKCGQQVSGPQHFNVANYNSEDAPRLASLLIEMKDGLDQITSIVEPLIQKVKEGMYTTKDGLSFLDAKHLLLLSYCQYLVYYLLKKAEGSSVRSHPLIYRLVEIRLYLEKIRPIEKKLQYQVDKLSRVANNPTSTNEVLGKSDGNSGKDKEDALKYRPNPDLLVSKMDESANDGIYKPPKFAPTAMDEEKDAKVKKMEMRKEKEMLHKASRSAYVKDLANELEGRPDEVREVIGAESKELSRERYKLEKRAKQEEDMFTRVPLTRKEKSQIKHLKRSRNGLMGFLDDFSTDISGLMKMEDTEFKRPSASSSHGFGDVKRRSKKHKVKR